MFLERKKRKGKEITYSFLYVYIKEEEEEEGKKIDCNLYACVTCWSCLVFV